MEAIKGNPRKGVSLASERGSMSVMESRVTRMETDLVWIKEKINNIETKLNWFLGTAIAAVIAQVVSILVQ